MSFRWRAISDQRRACCLALLLASACASTRSPYVGFNEQDARAIAKPSPYERLDACQARDGRLVLEVEHALVREYPSHGIAALDGKQQPLLLVSLLSAPAWPREAELMPVVAPAEFRAGDSIGFFEGKRLIDRPMRTLRGRQLQVRLLENNRTAAPSWQRYAEAVTHAGVGALSALGMPGPPTSVVDVALSLLARLDRDSLILRWDVDIDGLARALPLDRPGETLRFRLHSARETPAGPGRGLPSAELQLLVYREPEPGCQGAPSLSASSVASSSVSSFVSSTAAF